MPNHATNTSSMDHCICGCGGGACIPQRRIEKLAVDPLSQDELREIISFSVAGRCGYPLNDAVKKQYTGLDGRDDRMFVGSKSSISLRLEVRLTDWRNRAISLNQLCSGCRMRSGQDRSASSPVFHCVEADML